MLCIICNPQVWGLRLYVYGYISLCLYWYNGVEILLHIFSDHCLSYQNSSILLGDILPHQNVEQYIDLMKLINTNLRHRSLAVLVVNINSQVIFTPKPNRFEKIYLQWNWPSKPKGSKWYTIKILYSQKSFDQFFRTHH